MEQAPQPAAPEQAVVTPPPASRILSESRDKPPKKHWGMAVLLGIIVLLLAGVGSAYAYFMRVPVGTIEEALVAMESINSYRSHTQIAVRIHAPENDAEDDLAALGVPSIPSNVSLDARSAFDTVRELKTNFETAITLQSSQDGSQNNMAVSFDVKGKDDVYYLNIKDLPTLGFFDLSAVTNQWISLDLSEGADESSLGGMLRGFSSTLDETLSQTKEERAARQQAMLVRAKEVIEKTPLFSIEKVYVPQYKDGRLLTHVTYVVNKDAVVTVMTTLINEFESDSREEDQRLIEDVTAFSEKIGTISGEMWLDRQSGYIYRMTFNTEILAEDGIDTIAEITGSVDYSDFNEIIIIDAPAESKPVEQVIEEVMGSMFGMPMGDSAGYGSSMYGMPADDGTDTDGDGLSDYREYMLGLDETNADTDGDGIPDGEDDSLDMEGYSMKVYLDDDYAGFGSMYEDSMMEIDTFPMETDYPGLGPAVDSDGDGLSDELEALFGSDPNNPDSDGDGYFDGEEVNNGYSPVQ